MSPENLPLTTVEASQGVAEPQPEVKAKTHLPEKLEIKTKSHALRLARMLFGPLTRLGELKMGGEPVFTIKGVCIGCGPTFKEALENACVYVESVKAMGKTVDGLLNDSRRDVTVGKRQELISAMMTVGDPRAANTVLNGVLKLMPHEVMAAAKLNKAVTDPEVKLQARSDAETELKNMVAAAAERQDKRPRRPAQVQAETADEA